VLHDFASESIVRAILTPAVVGNTGAVVAAAVDMNDCRQCYLMISMTVGTTDDWTACAVWDSADAGVADAYALHTTVGTVGVGGTELSLTELLNTKRNVQLRYTEQAGTADSFVCALIIGARQVRV